MNERVKDDQRRLEVRISGNLDVCDNGDYAA